MSIKVSKLNDTQFMVDVRMASTTQHQVTVNHDYALTLSAGKVSTEVLIEKSFEFLLAREPNTSILRSFDLSVIERYFPEYSREIKKLL